MGESQVIQKNRELRTSQDYAALRALGLKYVTDVSSKIWTDHNLHDPGITTLEILCFALTDLGYRTGFPIEDLLTKEDGEIDPPDVSGLFPAHEILTCSPLTIDDYRRLLMKIEGIRNAWLDPLTDADQPEYRESEIPIYANCLDDVLSDSETNAAGESNQRVRLTGLYKVLLELETDDVLGSLNERRLVFRIPRDALKGVVVSLDTEHVALIDGSLDISGAFQSHTVDSVVETPDGFTAAVVVTVHGNETIRLENLVIRVVDASPNAQDDPVTVTLAALTSMLAKGESDGLVPLFWQKLQARQQSIDAACCALDAHRSLCEDYLEIRPIEADRFAVCADVDVESDVDLETVQANVLYEIEKYLNPPVHYHTLQEMLDDGKSPDEIFNGPFIDFDLECNGAPVFTKPGFITQDDLDGSKLRKVIYVSDIINQIMDVPGVVAIRNFQLRRVDGNGNFIGDSEKWCMEVTSGQQPLLEIDSSKVMFYKGEIPYRAQSSEFEDALDYLRAMDQKAAYVDPDQALATPTGKYRRPDQFHSIQHDYPRTYAIGDAGLPLTADAQRVAQARQFKGYLTFFDQLLADYLAQLANVRRLLSLDASLDRTYFSQYLTEIAGVRNAFEDELYADKTVLADENQRTLLTEDEALFRARRNRFLDHILARFAVQFTDYALLIFDMEGGALASGDDLIADKLKFLGEYPVLSRDRNRAMNYRPESASRIWDTDNVAGLQKRVARLLGIQDYTRRNLACDAVFDLLFTIPAVGGSFRVEVRDARDAVLFASKETFASEAAGISAASDVYATVRSEAGNAVDATDGTGQVFFTLRGGETSLQNDAFYETEADAYKAIRAIIERHDEILLSEEACDHEGLHLFEHTLLRPFAKGDELMQVCLDEDCDLCGEEDPYSFRISVVLPYWPKRFQSLDFRTFFERTLREEAPAHIHARICWIDNGQMAELDAAHRAWLEAKADKNAGVDTLSEPAGALIRLLGQLKTIYPAAVLHDCEDGGDENPVRLGSTNLGLF